MSETPSRFPLAPKGSEQVIKIAEKTGNILDTILKNPRTTGIKIQAEHTHTPDKDSLHVDIHSRRSLSVWQKFLAWCVFIGVPSAAFATNTGGVTDMIYNATHPDKHIISPEEQGDAKIQLLAQAFGDTRCIIENERGDTIIFSHEKPEILDDLQRNNTYATIVENGLPEHTSALIFCRDIPTLSDSVASQIEHVTMIDENFKEIAK